MRTAETGVSYALDGSIVTIILHRPQTRNALDGAAIRALGRAFDDFEADERAAVAVLFGKGGSFCAGADLKEISDGAGYEAWAGSLDGVLGAPRSKPIVAAVEGHAVAGGLGVALYCDLRIADETAVFGVFCRRFGVPMSDGTTVRLPRLIGESRAMDMMLTGRGVSAAEAHAAGLVSEVVPEGTAYQRARAIAEQIAGYPQTALRSDRWSLVQSRGLGLEQALVQECELAEEAKRTDAQTGAARFASGTGRHGSFEKR